MTDRLWPFECIHGAPIEDGCQNCREIGATNAADYGAYEPLIRPERIKLLLAAAFLLLCFTQAAGAQYWQGYGGYYRPWPSCGYYGCYAHAPPRASGGYGRYRAPAYRPPVYHYDWRAFNGGARPYHEDWSRTREW